MPPQQTVGSSETLRTIAPGTYLEHPWRML
jgi:hypothetical protein